jgi:hypothetical protein
MAMHEPNRINTCPVVRSLLCTGMTFVLLFTQTPTRAAAADATAASKLTVFVRGDDLCGMLGPRDFDAAGVKGARPPSSNNNPPTDYYCVYAGKSSYMGGIEFDAFLADSTRDASRTFKTVTEETADRDGVDRATLLGVDQALLSLKAPGETGPVASLSVRKGKFVFVISFPSSAQAEAQLLALARTALQRGDQLTQ